MPLAREAHGIAARVELVLEKLAANKVLLAAALPRTFSPLLISRYEVGMS